MAIRVPTTLFLTALWDMIFFPRAGIMTFAMEINLALQKGNVIIVFWLI